MVGRTVLVMSLVLLGGLCAPERCVAQEGDPDPHGAAIGSGSVTAPSVWANVNVPVHQRIDLKLYGFYIGDLDVTFRTS